MRRALIVVLAVVLGGCPQASDPPAAPATAPDPAPTSARAPGRPRSRRARTRSRPARRRSRIAARARPSRCAATSPPTAGRPASPMTNDGTGTWTATVPANDEQVILYKFVRRRHVDRRSREHAHVARRLRRLQLGRPRRLRHCPHAAAMDWRDGIMYFVVIDRFADGDTANDAPVPAPRCPASTRAATSPASTQKIDAGYFTDLGINTLWITSPLDNTHAAYPGADGHIYSGYHGYWPEGRDDDRLALRHRGRPQGDGRRRARATASRCCSTT